MKYDLQLESVIARWYEATSRGQILTAEDLCADRPEMLDVVEREILAREFDRLEIPAIDVEETGDTVHFKRGAAPGVESGFQPGAEPIPGYRLLAKVGRGGSGEVWKARGPGGFEIALKFVRLGEPNDFKDSWTSRSWSRSHHANLRSLELMRELRHPCVLPLFGAWHRNGQLVIAMELAEGTLLDKAREAIRRGEAGIPRDELLALMRQAAQGIDYLNEPRHSAFGRENVGILHCDIKPQNLLVVGGAVKVADFGLARILDFCKVDIGSLTPAYAAPESISGGARRETDQYSFAVSYYQLATGRLPFMGNHWEILMGHRLGAPDLSMLPEPERAVVGRALSKTPERRWPSCVAFVEALASCSLVPEVVTAPEPEKPASSRPSPAILSPARTRLTGFLGIPLLAGLILAAATATNLGKDQALGEQGPPRLAAVILVDEAPTSPSVEDTTRSKGLEDVFAQGRALGALAKGKAMRFRAIVGDLIESARRRGREAVAFAERRRAEAEALDRIRAEGRRAEARRRAEEAALRDLVERQKAAKRDLAWSEAEAARLQSLTKSRTETATITVLMPTSGSDLIVRGEVGKGSPDEWYGPRRVLHTPPFEIPTKYLIGAFWKDDRGGPVTRSLSIKVEPGREYEVDLQPSSPTWREVKKRPLSFKSVQRNSPR